jgi:hypothetical protein
MGDLIAIIQRKPTNRNGFGSGREPTAHSPLNQVRKLSRCGMVIVQQTLHELHGRHS